MCELIFKYNKNICDCCHCRQTEKILLEKNCIIMKSGAEIMTSVPLIQKSGEEFSETLPRILSERKLNDRCVVITGHICIGMGQTFTSPEFGSFTHAIIGHMDLTNEMLYQLFGRLTGRMKPHETNPKWTQPYIPTKVFLHYNCNEPYYWNGKCAHEHFAEKASSQKDATCTQSEYRDLRWS